MLPWLSSWLESACWCLRKLNNLISTERNEGSHRSYERGPEKPSIGNEENGKDPWMDAGVNSDDGSEELKGNDRVNLFDKVLSCGLYQRVTLLEIHKDYDIIRVG